MVNIESRKKLFELLLSVINGSDKALNDDNYKYDSDDEMAGVINTLVWVLRADVNHSNKQWIQKEDNFNDYIALIYRYLIFLKSDLEFIIMSNDPISRLVRFLKSIIMGEKDLNLINRKNCYLFINESSFLKEKNKSDITFELIE